MASLAAHFFLIVGGLVAVFLCETQAPFAQLPWWSLLPLLVMPHAAHKLSSALSRRSSGLATRSALLITVLVPLLVELAFLFLTDFASRTTSWSPWTTIPGWPGFETLLQLLPLVIGHLSITARPGEALLPSLLSPENVRTRLALFSWSVLGVYLVVSLLVGHIQVLRIWIEESTPASLAFSLAALAVLLVVVPRLLLAVLAVVPLEGYHRRIAEELGGSLGVRAPRLFEWRTGDELANAMVLAMPFGPRPVLFTDVFLRQLSMTEFRAVLAHELGHVAGRHVGLFASLVLGLALLVEALFGGLLDGPGGEYFALAFLIFLVLVVGFVSRRLELEADLYALEATGETLGLEAALRRAGGHNARKKSWRHFPTATRAIFLRAAAHDPGVGERLRAGIRGFRRLAIGLLVAGALATVWDAARRLPVERFWIDVREARFAAASERLATLDAADFLEAGDRDYASPGRQEQLHTLVGLAMRLQEEGETLTTQRIGELAEEQLELGNLYRVAVCRDLAFLIGDPDAGQLSRALAGDEIAAESLPTWKPVLAELRRSP